MLLRLLFCMFDRHRPLRTSVRWSGVFHISECRDCGRTIRKSGKGYWKRFTAPPLGSKE